MNFDIGYEFTFGCLTEATITDITQDFAKVQLRYAKSIPCSVLQKMYDDDWEYTGQCEVYPDHTGHKTIREYLFKKVQRI